MLSTWIDHRISKTDFMQIFYWLLSILTHCITETDTVYTHLAYICQCIFLHFKFSSHFLHFVPLCWSLRFTLTQYLFVCAQRQSMIAACWLGLLPVGSIQFRVGCLSKRFRLATRPSLTEFYTRLAKKATVFVLCALTWSTSDLPWNSPL